MTEIREEARAFTQRRNEEQRVALQTAAFYLASGIDLDDALAARAEARSLVMLRLERLIERERLRGMRRHWSYDLNRHIALKQVLDRLRKDAPCA